MAIRRAEARKLRQKLISRTARIWTRLNKKLVQELNETAQSWLQKLLKQARKDIAVGDISDEPKFPEKFSKELKKI